MLSKLNNLSDYFEVKQYGALPIDEARYPLVAVVPKKPDSKLPDVLVTGGVHGYETSGVQGALAFVNEHAGQYSHLANVYVLPCVSPWGYETINRWNPKAIDPNRSFTKESGCYESEAVITLLENCDIKPVLHIDLHETTDTDNTEFRPALAAKDAIDQDVWDIPDGFYLVADTPNPQLAFQQAITAAVEKVTHIADSDENNQIIGCPVLGHGIICYDKKSLFLCAGLTKAKYVSTTEVYPDSPRTNDSQCNAAQVAAVCAAIDFVLNVKD